MFYSHQLLARKAPLGQIWMAATLNSKINRKKLDKLDIIQICEEILNPTVPMSLRLTGILMGGVVIVYQRKVELLYDDLSRLVSELNEAGKIRSNQFTDRTILPKGKAQAKYEAVTLPVPEHMQLADMEEEFVNMDIGDDNQHHQEDTVNITILDHVTFSGGNRYDRFERFDMGEEEIHFNETNTERNRPSPIIQSSPPQYEDAAPFDTTFAMPSSPCHPQDPPQGGLSEKQDEQGIEINDEEKQQQPQKPKARKRKRAENNNGRNKVVFDNDQTIVANPVYQSWLKDTSNILRERRKVNQDPVNAMKLTTLLELPPVGIITAFEDFPPKFYYPQPVMDLWKECIKFNYSSNKEKSPTGIRSPNLQQEANIPDNGFYYPQDIPEFPQEIYENDSAEHLRFAGSSEIPGNFSNGSVNTSGSEVLKGVRGSAEILPGPEIFPVGRSKKRQSFSNGQLLEPVLEEPNYGSFKIKDLSENGTIPEDLIEETGPTQTPIRRTFTDTPVDAVTQSIRMQFKTHFETRGAPQKESLDQLTHGMDPKQAARLFYQTCVLATCNYVKVEQPEPYEEIFISKGPKM